MSSCREWGPTTYPAQLASNAWRLGGRVAYGLYLAKGETSRTTMSLHLVSLRIVAAASAKARPSAAVVVVVPKLSDCATATAGEALTPVLRDNCGALATLRPP